jgi:CDP-diglyceride synthetase
MLSILFYNLYIFSCFFYGPKYHSNFLYSVSSYSSLKAHSRHYFFYSFFLSSLLWVLQKNALNIEYFFKNNCCKNKNLSPSKYCCDNIFGHLTASIYFFLVSLHHPLRWKQNKITRYEVGSLFTGYQLD